MAFQVTTQQSWTITIANDDGQDHLWKPAEIETSDGKPFVRIDKWDRKLVKACVGKSMNVSADTSQKVDANVRFMDELMKARQDACNEKLAAALAPPPDQDEPYAKRRNKTKKPRTAKKKDIVFLPHVCELTMDGFEDDDGVVGPTTIEVLTKAFWTRFIWVSLDPATIKFVIRAIRNDLKLGRVGRRRRTSRSTRSEDGDNDDADEDVRADNHDNENDGVNDDTESSASN